MNNIEEVKKLKKLLDDGIIDEDDFKKRKEILFGLSDGPIKEVKENRKILDDYEKKLMEQSKGEENEEKLKARATIEVEEEAKNRREAEKKVIRDKNVNKVKNILKWVLAVTLWIFGIGSLCVFNESGLIYIPLGIIMIFQGCMACPQITEYTQKFEKYTKLKKAIIWITIILWIILCVV